LSLRFAQTQTALQAGKTEMPEIVQAQFGKAQAFAGQFYMRSRLIWVSPLAPRSGTLRKVPVTCSYRPPSDPMADQPM